MGLRRKTRKILTSKPNSRGMLKISAILREIPVGTSVAIDYNPSYQPGISHRRFQGQVGVIRSRTKRNFYSVLIKRKILITTAPHLKIIKQ